MLSDLLSRLDPSRAPSHGAGPSASAPRSNNTARTQLELEGLLGSLLQDYRDLQAPLAHTLDAPPTSLEALRMVHAAHPAVIKGYSPFARPAAESAEKPVAPDWDAAETYERIIGADREVSIAITDDGRADAVRYILPSSSSISTSTSSASSSAHPPTPPGGLKAFIKPHVARMPLRSFLARLRACSGSGSGAGHGAGMSSRDGDAPPDPEALYLESQDGNIWRSVPREGGDELQGMREWVRRDVGWMREAVGESADAVNLWIGSERSSTSLHHDPYDNVYHVLSGTKTFTLISPIEGLWLDQQFFPPGTLHRPISTSSPNPTPPHPPTPLIPLLDPAPARAVPWVESTLFPAPIQPIRVTLRAGETLFLPAGWWHAVEQCEGPGGVAVAVNYWYDSPIRPQQHALLRLAQRSARLAGRRGVIPVDPESDSDSDRDEENADPHPPRNTAGGERARAGADGGEDSGQDLTDGVWGDQGVLGGASDDEEEEEWDPTEWRAELARVKADKRAMAVDAVKGSTTT